MWVVECGFPSFWTIRATGKAGHSPSDSDTDGIFAYHSSGGSKDLDGRHMARIRSESSIPCNERSSELLGKHDVGGIIEGDSDSEGSNHGNCVLSPK
jgi:hypothetical protein